jgi:8-oxo-dGTP pyrophosphatase MutT (NUDIX family)
VRDATCAECGGTGFRGRLALVEVIIASQEFASLVAAGESTEQIAEAARADGMRSLWKSGMAHAAAGRTTMEEVLRVATPDDEARVVAEPAAKPLRTTVSRPFAGSAFQLRDDLDTAIARSRHRRRSFTTMADVQVGTVDVFVIRPLASGWRVLALQRGSHTRCPTAWEPVHGHIERGEEPEDAAIREVREETGLTVEKLYSVRVQPFYLHKTHTVQLAIVFAAFVAESGDVAIAAEHQSAEWLTVGDALQRFAFPGERASLLEAVELLRTGDAGPVEDVMRVR